MKRSAASPPLRTPLRVLISVILLGIFFVVANDLHYHQKWGIEVILELQQYRNKWSDAFMRICSLFGFETFFVLLPGFVWCGNVQEERRGLRLWLVVQLVSLGSAVLKLIYLEERPIHIRASDIATSTAGSLEFSFPSGHAWATTTAWLFISFTYASTSSSFRKWALWISSVIIIGLTSFSRVWFGVHYPHDVICGICLGIVLFLNGDHFMIKEFFDKETDKQENKEDIKETWAIALLLFTCLVSFSLAITIFDHEHRKKQLLLFNALGTIAGCIALKPFIIYTIDNTNSLWKFFFRMVVGLPPIFGMVYMIKIVYIKYLDLIEPALFLIGFGFFVWLSILAPLTFNALSLSGIHRDDTFKEKQIKND